jgi:hypothetical protein
MKRAVLLLLALAFGLCGPLPAAAQQDPAVLDRINARIQSEGRARVIVELRLPAGAHVPETFVAAGVSNRTWDVIMPTAPGCYEFRLLFIKTYTVAARSPVVTVGN